MFEEREIITLLLGVAVLTFILWRRKELNNLPHINILLAGYSAFLAGWLFTVAESLLWHDALNVLEHLSIAAGSVFLLAWCRKISAAGKRFTL